MDAPLARFLRMSAVLTGYSPAELTGTGLAQTYLDETAGTAGPTALAALLTAFEAVMAGGPDGLDQRMNDAVLNDTADANGPLAKNILRLWFTGTWSALGDLWHAQNGGDPQDTDRVVSAQAYREGLVWPTIDSHPQAAKQPGFGTWGFPPAPFGEV